jgi:2-dehydropantoate 2-reductase
MATALNESGFETHVADNVDDLIWGKLIINVGINALTALTRLKNGMLPDVAGTRRIMEDAVDEAVQVVEGKGINLPYPNPKERVVEVCRATAENKASMLQDILNQRITEVDFINGAIVREAEKLGIPTPVNSVLTNLMEAIQETYGDRVRA